MRSLAALFVVCIACILSLPAVVVAQDGPVDAFNKAFDSWKAVLNQLREIQKEYKVCKPEQRAGLEKQFNDKLAEAEHLLPGLRRLAEAAYLADNKQTMIGDFLGAMAESDLESDNYFEAARLAQLLIEQKYANTDTFRVAGVASFYIGKLDDAERYLKLAGPEKSEGIRKEGNLLEMLPKERQLWEEELMFRAAEDKPDDDPMALPRALIKTTKGDILVELFENEAPNTVANFINLAENKFYDGLTFHRVLEHFVAQGGDPKGNGQGGPGYNIKCECNKPVHRKHFIGSLSMAHTGIPDTGGSQFFITFMPLRHLDGRHTVFGRVLTGFDVLSKLTRRDPEKSDPPEPDKIVSITVLRKRNHPYVPEKVTSGDAPAKPAENKPEENK